ncbi:hypothetical protein B0T16DRAFT_490830 [Cercophora newfieldiana]|uniref:2EXR domain-containing protein n=1 Tax=Cercophora newfieldiana TaxID=92897 RepID=A0AA40CWD6_9PEZI|nr:hypothetical protein B0T16DRAFT_490830 [Cercophora newfieldiana]
MTVRVIRRPKERQVRFWLRTAIWEFHLGERTCPYLAGDSLWVCGCCTLQGCCRWLLPSGAGDPSFHHFPLLPTELRLKIWKLSLQRRRIIRINIHLYEYQPDVKEVDKPNENDKHFPVVAGYQSLSKLLRVNRESRQAAQEFYRVHFPCRFLLADKDFSDGPLTETTRPGTFYFNPEHDFLLISSSHPAGPTLLDFIHRLKTVYDPRRVGLLNLAVDTSMLNVTQPVTPRDVSPEVGQAFAETLAQLRAVYSVFHTAAGRQSEGWRSGFTGAVFFNRSMPLIGAAPTFEVLPRDPRPIAEDLRKVYTGFSRSFPYQALQEMFRIWGVKPAHDLEHRLLLGFTPPYRVYDRDSAKRWLKKEDDHWNWCAEGGPTPGAREGSFASINWPALKIPKEDLQRVPRPAVGFWLFPVEAMTDKALGNDALTDLSGYWPELALTSLP